MAVRTDDTHPATKQCPRCTRVLGRHEFGLNKTKPDGLQTWCKKCRRDAALGLEQRTSRRG